MDFLMRFRDRCLSCTSLISPSFVSSCYTWSSGLAKYWFSNSWRSISYCCSFLSSNRSILVDLCFFSACSFSIFLLSAAAAARKYWPICSRCASSNFRSRSVFSWSRTRESTFSFSAFIVCSPLVRNLSSWISSRLYCAISRFLQDRKRSTCSLPFASDANSFWLSCSFLRAVEMHSFSCLQFSAYWGKSYCAIEGNYVISYKNKSGNLTCCVY